MLLERFLLLWDVLLKKIAFFIFVAHSIGLLLIHSFEFHYLLYVNNFSHLLVCLKREFIKHQLWKNAILLRELLLFLLSSFQ